MAEGQTISTAATLIESVIIILPLWIAAVRYFMDEFEADEDEIHLNFVLSVILFYFALAAILVSASGVITASGDDALKPAIYALYVLFFSTGLFPFEMLRKSTDLKVAKWVLRISTGLAFVFSMVSLGLLVLTAI